MMTFLPFADFKASAEALDTKRLQNQRTEARFVLEWLENRGFDLRAYGAARMWNCLLYTSPSPRDGLLSRMPSSA